MESVLDRLPAGSRVAILRLRSLGDCVLTTPALDILKRARPDLKLAIVVEDRFRPIFEGNPDLDALLGPRIGALREWAPRLCLNLHGGTRSAWITALSGAPYRAGFAHFRNGFAYNVRIPRAQEILGVERKVHTAEHLASAIFFLGAPAVEIPRAKLHATARAAACPAIAVIHPAASSPEKTWPAANYVAVADYLKQNGITPVFIGAGNDDLSAFRSCRTVCGAPLGEIKNLLAAATLFIGNDSGPAHIAAAFGVPVVVIFGNSDPVIWGPWRTQSEIVSSPHGIQAVAVNPVLEALARLRVHA